MQQLSTLRSIGVSIMTITMAKLNNSRAQYSGGPKVSASSDSSGVRKSRAAADKIPPTPELSAARLRAKGALPSRAME